MGNCEIGWRKKKETESRGKEHYISDSAAVHLEGPGQAGQAWQVRSIISTVRGSRSSSMIFDTHLYESWR